MDISDDKFQRTCRTCLMQDQNFHSIFENIGNELKICEMLATVTPQLWTLRSEKLPKQMCKACLNKLNIAYGFQQMCISSEEQLLNAINSEKSNSSNALNVSAVVKMEQDLLLDQECVKLDVGEEVKNIDLEQNVHSEQVENDNSNEAEMRLLDRSRNNSDADDNDHDLGNNQDDDDLSTSPTKEVFTQSMHNETGVDEIEKPTPRNHRKLILACPLCDKVFYRPYNLKRHAEVHSPTRRYQCHLCTYRFYTVHQLWRHKFVHENAPATHEHAIPPDGYKCAECPRRFEKREGLSAHIQSHRKTDPTQTFKCELCPKKFCKFNELTKHASTHPENQKYKCSQCEKTFGKQAHIIEHMNKHNGLKPFVCIYCNKAFLENSTLEEHQRTHTGETPFLCLQCGKSFKNASDMRQHLLQHSDERCYQCRECPSKFACHSDQIKHMSTHRAITRSYTLTTKHKQLHTSGHINARNAI